MTDFDPFAGGAIERSVDSTEAQREIWLAVKFGGDQASLAYNESVTLALRGEVDTDLLRTSTNNLLVRHDALRSTFSADGQTMVVNTDPTLDLEVLDLSELAEEEQHPQRIAVREKEVRQVFDLEHGPLVRFRLLHIADDRHDLIITAHHIICDGWSFGVLVEELDALCKMGGKPASDMQAAPSFVEHAVADRKALYGPQADAAELYWLDLLGENPQELDIPTDHPRYQSMIDIDSVPTRDLSALRIDRILDAEATTAANDVAKSSGAGLSAMMLAVFAILLRRLSGQEDFVIGVPAAAQAHTGQYGLVGHCVQMLPIRIQCTGDITVTALAKSIKTSLLDGFENQGLTFGALLQRLRLQRDAARVPLIPIMYNLDQAFENEQLGEYQMELISNPRFAENFEIFLNITPKQDQLTLEATYRTGLFDQATIENWLESYQAILSNATEQPDSRIDNIDCLSIRQRDQQLREWNDTMRAIEPAGATVLSRICEIARLNPDKVAVQDHNESLSYQVLLQRADRIADTLMAAEVPAGANIGICRAPSADMIAGLLGIWRAQCAYIPLDPDYPEERLRYIIDDTKIGIILGDENHAPNFAVDCQWLKVDGKTGADDITIDHTPCSDDTAYIIHTSGSTGQPKGVIIEHAALDNLISAMAREPGMDANTTLLAVTSLSFDISTLELFLPLTIGAKVVLASREQIQDSFALTKLLSECDADYMQATPSAWQALLDSGWQGDSKLTALCGGEALPLSLAQTLAPKVRKLWNMYGPTEATVWSTIEQIDERPEQITIGQPIDNTSALVLDEQFNLLPPGAIGGELLLGGSGLAQGYLGQAALTQEQFPKNPFNQVPGNRLYRTGDLVKLDAHGHIHFVGRKDNQVKIRGYRVELGEIESILASADEVNTAVAVIREYDEGDSRLVAYVTAEKQQKLDSQSLFTYVQSKLPPQSVPQHIVVLEEIPQTANGKIDRKALPDPVVSSDKRPTELSTHTQKQLGEIWRDLLRVKTLGAEDDFFLLGGHSMVAVRMLARVREIFALELPLQSIFLDRTVANLAARIDLLQMQKDSVDNPAHDDAEVVEF